MNLHASSRPTLRTSVLCWLAFFVFLGCVLVPTAQNGLRQYRREMHDLASTWLDDRASLELRVSRIVSLGEKNQARIIFERDANAPVPAEFLPERSLILEEDVPGCKRGTTASVRLLPLDEVGSLAFDWDDFLKLVDCR